MLWFAIFFVATSALAWFGAARHGQHTEDRWWVTSLRVSVAISTALVLLSLWLMGSSLAASPMEDLAESLPTAAWACLGGAVWIRAGLFPFHGWVLGMAQKLPMVLATPWLMAPVGVYMVARLSVTSLEGPPGAAVLMILTLAAVQALYGSMLAFGAKSLRTMIGSLALADTALAIVAIVEGDEHTLSGGLLMVLSNAVALTGMWIIAAAAASRTGNDHMHRLTGFAQRAPMLSMWFMVFAVAGFGLPGSPAFVATELVVHGSWQSHPAFAGLFVVVQALTSVVLWRAWTIAFLGTPASAVPVSPLLSVQLRPHPIDAMPRERWGALILAGVGLIMGLLPAAALDFERPAVDQLLDHANKLEDYGREAGNPAGYTIVSEESAATASGENTMGISMPPSQLSN
jgi:NADH:ubiquinone oxidoreductase subunit 4 (subunit M)